MYEPYLTDDDEEMRKMRERFMMAQPQQAPYGAAVGGVESYGAPAPELDPRAVASFLSQRPAEEPRGMYPIPQRDEGSWLENNGFAAAAAIADLIANKGRGLGQIVQGAVQGEQYRRKRSDDAFENDRAAYLKQGEAAALDKQIGLAGRNADMRQQEIDLQTAHQRAVMERFLSGEGSPEAKAADVRYKQALALKAERDATLDPNVVTPYQQAQIDEMKWQHKTQADDLDLDREDRKAGREATAAATKAQQDATAAQRGETNSRLRESTDRTAMSDFANRTKDARMIAKRLQGAEEVLGLYPKDIPGVGKAEGNLPTWANPENWSDKTRYADADRMVQAREGASAAFRYLSTGAAASMNEDERLRIVNGMREGATEQEFRLGIGTLSDLIKRDIRARAIASPELSRRVLDEDQLGNWVFGRSQPQSLPEAAPGVAPEPVRLGGSRGAAGGGNNFQFSGPPAGDVLPVQPGKPPMVNDYLQRLKDEDDDLGVVYR